MVKDNFLLLNGMSSDLIGLGRLARSHSGLPRINPAEPMSRKEAVSHSPHTHSLLAAFMPLVSSDGDCPSREEKN